MSTPVALQLLEPMEAARRVRAELARLTAADARTAVRMARQLARELAIAERKARR